MKKTLLEIKYLLEVHDAIAMLQHTTNSTTLYDVQKECKDRAHALWYITYSYKIDSTRDLSLEVERNLRLI